MERLHYHIGYQVKRANHALSMALEAAVRPLGITLAQANALLAIDRFPLATAPLLAELGAVTPQAMHRTVTGLEHRGLVQRERRAGNAKSYILSLTAQGTQLLAVAEVRVKATQDAVKDRLSPDEIARLHELLEKYEAVFADHKRRTKDE